MRAVLCLLFVAICCGGCASFDRVSAAEAKAVNLSRGDLAALVSQAKEKYHMAYFQRVERPDPDTVSIWLAQDRSGLYGVAVVYRKVDGSWREDTKELGQWIV